MKILKALNPLIWCWNLLKYFAHLEQYRGAQNYQRYDFAARDTNYFVGVDVVAGPPTDAAP